MHQPDNKPITEKLVTGSMKHPFFLVALLVSVLVLILSPTVPGQERNPADARAKQLEALVNDAVRQTLAKFADKQLKPDQLAVTLVELRDPQHPVSASYRGDAQIYPASVVKLFYLVAAHRWLENGKLQDTDELRRALRDMIVQSYN